MYIYKFYLEHFWVWYIFDEMESEDCVMQYLIVSSRFLCK